MDLWQLSEAKEAGNPIDQEARTSAEPKGKAKWASQMSVSIGAHQEGGPALEAPDI